MTDKQIIIDGVNVSGCCQYMPRYMEDYDIDTLDYCRRHFKPCKDVDVKYCYYKQLKRKEQECEELKKELQAQRAFTAQEQRKIYCVAYDKTCETGNEYKQKKCVFKDRLKYKQALDEIRQYRVCEINDVDGEENDVILGIIDEVMEP